MTTPAITPLNPLVEKIRATHPGSYDDMDDATLTKKVLAKYPQYEDLARPSTPIPGSPATQQPMSQVDITGKPQTPEAATAGLPGMTGNRPVMGADLAPGAIAAGVAASVASPTVLAAGLPAAQQMIRAQLKAHPTIAKIIISEAISHARGIPGLGKLIPPYAEMAPFLIGEGGGEESEPDATSENRPFAGGEDEYQPKVSGVSAAESRAAHDKFGAAEKSIAEDVKGQAASEAEAKGKFSQAEKSIASDVKAQAAKRQEILDKFSQAEKRIAEDVKSQAKPPESKAIVGGRTGRTKEFSKKLAERADQLAAQRKAASQD